MTRERVLVSGLGVVSALALNAKEHFQRLLHGESGVTVSTRPEHRNYPSKLEARVIGFDRRTMIADRMLRKLLSPSAAYAVAAAGEAIRDAGFKSYDPSMKDCGLYVGSIAADVDPEMFIPAYKESLNEQGDFELSRFAQRGMKLLDPLFLVKSLPNAGLCGISIQHQVLGPNINITNGPVSGLQAVAAAAAAIRRGEVEMALAGGYDSLLRIDITAEQIIGGRLSERQSEPALACRPFDKERDGYALGEGAAFLLLEAESHARTRSARVYGELLAVSHTNDTSLLHQRGAGDGSALEHAACHALRQADCTAEELGAIFGDGLATEADDLREAAGVRRLVGDAPVVFTAATAALGFTGAASGAFSLVHALMAIEAQVVPPLINCLRPDPRCGVPFVDRPQGCCYRRALVWNSDRGLKNVAMLIASYNE